MRGVKDSLGRRYSHRYIVHSTTLKVAYFVYPSRHLERAGNREPVESRRMAFVGDTSIQAPQLGFGRLVARGKRLLSCQGKATVSAKASLRASQCTHHHRAPPRVSSVRNYST
jgi:hypothetical protein